MPDLSSQARYYRNSKKTSPEEDKVAPIPSPETDHCDIIYGAENIARFLGVSIRKIYYLMECKKCGASSLPINKIPGLGLCANRQALLDHLSRDRQAE